MIKDRRKRNIANPPPIKVAILDTGCDGNSRHFKSWPRDKRRVEKNWVDFVQAGSKSLIDTDEYKHGTKITTIVLKLLPNAELYVGRVTREEKSLKDSLGIIKQVCPNAFALVIASCLFLSLAEAYCDRRSSMLSKSGMSI